MNPNAIDPNYFYGKFLIDQGEYAKAITVLEHALVAPDRPTRPIADAGRRAEIRQSIAPAKIKLGAFMAQVILTGIFGVFWTIFGLNAVLHFFPIPASSTEGAAFIYGGVRATGYIWPMMYASLVLTGAMLLSRRFVPLALILLALITFIVILYDLFLNPSGLVIGSM